MDERFASGLPFTNAEVFEALALVHPPEMVKAFRREHDAAGDQPTDMSVTDDILLVLAAMSDENASRVVDFRPDLKAQVERVKAHPQRFIEAERRRSFEYHDRERAEGSER